jgi:hypothetical protein
MPPLAVRKFLFDISPSCQLLQEFVEWAPRLRQTVNRYLRVQKVIRVKEG